MKLYRFTKGNIDTDQYVFSTIEDGECVRSWWNRWDHGGTDFREFEDVFINGIIEEITSKDQVDKTHLEIIPYCTDEWVGDDYFYIESSIGDYLP